MIKIIKVRIPDYIQHSKVGHSFIITNKVSKICLRLEFRNKVEIYFEDSFIYIKCAPINFYDATRIAKATKEFIELKTCKVSLKFVGIGYKAQLYDKKFLKVFLGFSHSLLFKVPKNILVVTNKEGTSLSVYCINKESIIEWVAYLKSFKKPGKHKNKGIYVVS